MLGYNDLVALLKRVKATRGLDTDMESVCNYQDMIGHSTDEELSELSNGEYKSEFYWVYSTAHRIEDTLNFYMHHSDKIFELRVQCDDLKCTNEELSDELVKRKAELSDISCKYMQSEKENAELEKENAALNAEIIKLKARLYDLMEA